MDLIKIGAFIKACRKEKNFTQEGLAEKLNISPKTVSKWECGNGLPDVSIMVDLCKNLSISVNELLNGEHIDKQDYMEKSEQKLLEMQQEKINSDKRLLTAEIYIGIFSTIISLVCVITASLLLEKGEYLYGGLLLGFGILLFLPAMAFCLYIEQKAGYYQCKHCNHKFIPTYSQVLWAPHYNRTRRMKCPNCNKKGYCKKVLK